MYNEATVKSSCCYSSSGQRDMSRFSPHDTGQDISGVTADIHDVPQESDPRGPAGEQTALTAFLYYLIDIGFCFCLLKKMEEEMQGGSENNGL